MPGGGKSNQRCPRERPRVSRELQIAPFSVSRDTAFFPHTEQTVNKMTFVIVLQYDAPALPNENKNGTRGQIATMMIA